MTHPILLSFLNADRRAHEIALRYWAGAYIDGKWKWTDTVKAVGEAFALRQHQVLPIVELSTKAFSVQLRCPCCDKPKELRSRSSSLASWESHEALCQECRVRRLNEEQANMRVQEQRQREEKLDALHRLMARNGEFNFERTPFIDAFLTYGLILSSDAVWKKGYFLGAEPEHLCPSKQLLSDVLARLFDNGVLQMSDQTSGDALVVNENGSASYFPLKAAWRLAPDKSGRKISEILNLLKEIIDRDRTSEDGYRAASRIWWTVGVDDLKQYLDEQAYEYGLAVNGSSEKLDHSLQHALMHLPIPQVRRKLLHVVKNAAALAQSRSFNKRHAENTIHGNIVKYVDQVLANDWTVSPVFRDC